MKFSFKRDFSNILTLSVSKWQIKLVLIAIGIFIVVSVVFYTNYLVEELIDRETKTIKLYTEFFQRCLSPNSSIEDIVFLKENITPTISFPIIITNEKNEPLGEDFTLNVQMDSALSYIEKHRFLVEYVQKMGASYKPIPIYDEKEKDKLLNKVYYSHSKLVDNLNLFPYIGILVIFVFIFIGYIAFSNIRKHEESKVWVGMAKEAAHQLGTPLSSILAWIEILKYNKTDPISIENTLNEMESDINRLNTIAVRFSKIGSTPELSKVNVAQQIESICNYFEKRLPHLGKKIEIIKNLDKSIFANLNIDLFGWVIENLLKNAAEAIESKSGFVKIKLSSIKSRKKIVITISDNGKGMTKKQKRQVFHPGFTTKKRGWGLGLSLCKRIVEDYHKGKIWVKDTSLNKGTTFAIELPSIIEK